MTRLVSPDSVHAFWFGSCDDWSECVARNHERWFDNGAALDDPLRERFGALLSAAGRGEYDHWMSTPRGALCLILTLDQFPRHIYRHTAGAFSFDPKALALCQAGVAQGLDARLSAVERSFFYLPMEHAEDIDVQDQGLALMLENLRNAPPQLVDYLRDAARYGDIHRDIIARFGRFPHRNAVLGRESSSAETDWLTSGAERFGQ